MPTTQYSQQLPPINFSYEINHSMGSAKKRFIYLEKLINKKDTFTEHEKLVKINRFFNLFQFVSDIQFKGQQDYWQTPNEFIRSFAGDCEDFSIAKYFMLLRMGVSPKKLKLVYVKVTTLNQAHMVLAYYKTPDDEPLILDNINGYILPASKRKDLIPVYSFNIDGVWLGQGQNQDKKIGESSQLRKWYNLLKKMDQEGKLK